MRVYLCVMMVVLVGAKIVPERGTTLAASTLLQNVLAVASSISISSSNGLQYYLLQYGPLLKVFITDFMDSYGLAHRMQMAIPMLAKLVLIGVYAAMQFHPSLLAFQETTQSLYIFLKHFDSPELRVMNDITDQVFGVFDNNV